MMGTMPLLMPKMGMNTKDCILKYTPNTDTAVLVKPMRMAFIIKVITLPMACMAMEGMPTI